MRKTHGFSFPGVFPSDPATSRARIAVQAKAATTHRDTLQVIENYPNCLKIQMWPITHSGFFAPEISHRASN
jgi:hypothetical protein